MLQEDESLQSEQNPRRNIGPDASPAPRSLYQTGGGLHATLHLRLGQEALGTQMTVAGRKGIARVISDNQNSHRPGWQGQHPAVDCAVLAIHDVVRTTTQ